MNSAEKEARGAIRYSLAALKNIGASAIATIVAAREAKGAYTSLADFAARLDPKALNKRGLETLAMAGAFDALEANRALVHGNVDLVMGEANRRGADAAIGISDLFGSGGTPQLALRAIQAWTPMDRLQREFDAIGFFLSGHPLDQYDKVLAKLGVSRFVDFELASQRGVTAARLAGIVISARERRSQKGNKFAFAMFSDTTGQFEAVIFSDTLAQAGNLLEAGTPVVLNVEAERDGDTLKMRVQSIESLDRAAEGVGRGLRLVFDPRQLKVAELKRMLKPGTKGAIEIQLALPSNEVVITVPGRWDVSPVQAGNLSTLPGVLDVVEI